MSLIWRLTARLRRALLAGDETLGLHGYGRPFGVRGNLMPLRFNMLLAQAGIDPADVRLLRHQDIVQGKTVYRLWRDFPAGFEEYQSGQAAAQRARFAAPYWASFVASPGGETLFVGLYRVEACTNVAAPFVSPLLQTPVPAHEVDLYALSPMAELSEFIGMLTIDWGDGARSWVQRADRQDKAILELRRAILEPEFPGYGAFMAQLSELESLPLSWRTALSASRGIYLLTCPRTNEAYVGAALGSDGFWGRWLDYARSGHGGNVGLKSREASDYRVSILETVASSATETDILVIEARWKAKLQSREMGLNRN